MYELFDKYAELNNYIKKYCLTNILIQILYVLHTKLHKLLIYGGKGF